MDEDFDSIDGVSEIISIDDEVIIDLDDVIEGESVISFDSEYISIESTLEYIPLNIIDAALDSVGSIEEGYYEDSIELDEFLHFSGIESEYMRLDEDSLLLEMTEQEKNELVVVNNTPPMDKFKDDGDIGAWIQRHRHIESLKSNFSGTKKLETILLDELNKHLEGPECSGIVGKHTSFTSAGNSNKGNFHQYIIRYAMNYLPDYQRGEMDYDIDWVLGLEEEVLKLMRAERIEQTVAECVNLSTSLNNFINFFKTKVSETWDKVRSKEELPNEYAVAITTDAYECPCGGKGTHSMLTPLVCIVIPKSSDSTIRLLNEPFICDSCGASLFLPHRLVVELESILTSVISTKLHKFPGYVFYRPPIAEIKAVMPYDFAKIIKLSEDITDSLVNVQEEVGSSCYYTSVYLRLLRFWEKEETKAQTDLNYKMENLEKHRVNDNDLQTVFQNSKFSWDLETDYLLFLDTLLNYMEGFGCFSLTHKSDALYRFCRLSGFRKECFSVEETIEWMKKYAWGLASLNPLKSVNSLQLDEEKISIKLEYRDTVRSIFMLRSLARSNEIFPSTHYSKWMSNPAYAGSKSDKVIDSAIESAKTDILDSVPKSRREWINSNSAVYDKSVWYSLYSLFKNIPRSVLNLSFVKNEFGKIILSTKFSTEAQFFGDDFEGFESDKMLTKTYRFDEFKRGFMVFGGYIFNSGMSDPCILNRAKVLHSILKKSGGLGGLFVVSDIPHTFKFKDCKEPDHFEKDMYVVEMILLSESIIPDKLLELRDNLPTDEFLREAKSSTHYYEDDNRLFEKYGEVIKCLL